MERRGLTSPRPRHSEVGEDVHPLRTQVAAPSDHESGPGQSSQASAHPQVWRAAERDRETQTPLALPSSPLPEEAGFRSSPSSHSPVSVSLVDAAEPVLEVTSCPHLTKGSWASLKVRLSAGALEAASARRRPV